MLAIIMKNYICIIIQCLLLMPIAASPIKAVFRVEMLPNSSDEYPFLKTVNVEREDQIIKFEIDNEKDNEKLHPLILLPQGIVCIRREEIKLDKSVDLNWIIDSYKDHSNKKENDEVDLKNPHGYFVINCESYNLFCYFCERPDKAFSMTVIKMNMLLESRDKIYYIGNFPSALDKDSWLQINDSRINLLANFIISQKHKGPDKLPQHNTPLEDEGK